MCKPQRTQRAPPTEADQRRRAGSEAGGAEGGTGKAGVEVKSLETSQRLWIQKEEEKIRCPPPSQWPTVAKPLVSGVGWGMKAQW